MEPKPTTSNSNNNNNNNNPPPPAGDEDHVGTGPYFPVVVHSSLSSVLDNNLFGRGTQDSAIRERLQAVSLSLSSLTKKEGDNNNSSANNPGGSNNSNDHNGAAATATAGGSKDDEWMDMGDGNVVATTTRLAEAPYHHHHHQRKDKKEKKKSNHKRLTIPVPQVQIQHKRPLAPHAKRRLKKMTSKAAAATAAESIHGGSPSKLGKLSAKIATPMPPLLHPCGKVVSSTFTPPMPPKFDESIDQTIHRLAPYLRINVGKDSKEYGVIQDLVGGHAVITKIERVVNPDLWKRFVTTRKEFLSSKSEDLSLLGELGLSEVEILRKHHISLNFAQHPLLEGKPYSDNVALLFHCTKANNVDAILSQGLDERLGNLNGSLGRGIYFTDNPSKALHYDNNSTLFVFAVHLGDCLQVGEMAGRLQWVREPEKSSEQRRNHSDMFFESIVGWYKGKNEYVIYNRAQCCPLYAITYCKRERSFDQFESFRSGPPPIGWKAGGTTPNIRYWPFLAQFAFAQMETDNIPVQVEKSGVGVGVSPTCTTSHVPSSSQNQQSSSSTSIPPPLAVSSEPVETTVTTTVAGDIEEVTSTEFNLPTTPIIATTSTASVVQTQQRGAEACVQMQLHQLRELGFPDEKMNLKILKKCKYAMEWAVDTLLNQTVQQYPGGSPSLRQRPSRSHKKDAEQNKVNVNANPSRPVSAQVTSWVQDAADMTKSGDFLPSSSSSSGKRRKLSSSDPTTPSELIKGVSTTMTVTMKKEKAQSNEKVEFMNGRAAALDWKVDKARNGNGGNPMKEASRNRKTHKVRKSRSRNESFEGVELGMSSWLFQSDPATASASSKSATESVPMEVDVSAAPTKEDCAICCMDYEAASDWEIRPCGHKLCRVCFTKLKVEGTTMSGKVCTFFKCPFCQHSSGEEVGKCPNGSMKVKYGPKPCAGYERYGSIKITYTVNDAVKRLHLRRKAYLPNNEEGRQVLSLLSRAWERRLIFTIGTSATTNRENTLVWNIHHKTSAFGGVSAHGYPDPSYLTRVKEELRQYNICT